MTDYVAKAKEEIELHLRCIGAMRAHDARTIGELPEPVLGAIFGPDWRAWMGRPVLSPETGRYTELFGEACDAVCRRFWADKHGIAPDDPLPLHVRRRPRDRHHRGGRWHT